MILTTAEIAEPANRNVRIGCSLHHEDISPKPFIPSSPLLGIPKKSNSSSIFYSSLTIPNFFSNRSRISEKRLIEVIVSFNAEAYSFAAAAFSRIAPEIST